MTATWINLAGLIFLMLLQPVGGIISDKVGRKPLLLFFGFGGVVYTYVLITYLPQVHAPIVSFLLVAVSYVLLTGYTSINALVKSSCFRRMCAHWVWVWAMRWPTRCSAGQRR